MPPAWFYFSAALSALLAAVLVVREFGRRRLEAAHRVSRRLSDDIIAGAVDAIVTIDSRGTIRSFNAAAERMFGYQAPEAVGQSVSVLMPRVEGERHDASIQRYQESGLAHIIGKSREVRCQRRDGTAFWGELSVSENMSGDDVLYTGMFRDLTARKDAQDRLARELRRLSLTLRTGGLVAWEYRDARQEFTFTLPKHEPDSGQLLVRAVSFNDALERVHQDDRRRVYELLFRSPRPDTTSVLEFRIADRSGEMHWVRNNVIANSAPDIGDADWIGVSVDVTAARLAEDRATALGRILDASRNEVYVFDRSSLRYRLVNLAARENLRYSNDEMLGKTPLDISGTMTLEKLLRLFSPLDKGERTLVSYSGRHRRKDGSTYPVDISVMHGVLDQHPVYFAIALDMTDQEFYEHRLRRTEEEHRLILEHAPCAVATLTLNGEIASINRAGLRLLDCVEEDVIGQSFFDLVPEEDRGPVASAFSALASGELDYAVTPHHIRDPDGSTISVQAHSGVVHDSDGAPERIVTMIHDLTDREARDKEIQEHREKLAHVSRLGTLGQMAAGLAHEINQPLAAIATYAQAGERLLSSDKYRREDLEHALGQVSSQAHRAGDVMRRMRALARGNNATREFCDASALVNELLPLVASDAHHKGVEIRCQIDKGLPRCYADPVQIQQVLLNLIRNGIDAMRVGANGPRVLTVGVHAADEHDLVFEVCDMGAGVPESSRASLFEPFFTTKNTGMGMGLSISKSIVAAHGGRIGYRPGPEGGALFWFSLPTEASKETV